MSQLWDWGFLDDCFSPTRIRVTDIDGLVERNDNFLLIEAKSPGKFIPTGQKIMFDILAKDDRWTVLILWGEPSQPEQAQIWGKSAKKEVTIKDIQNFVRKWFLSVNN